MNGIGATRLPSAFRNVTLSGSETPTPDFVKADEISALAATSSGKGRGLDGLILPRPPLVPDSEASSMSDF